MNEYNKGFKKELPVNVWRPVNDSGERARKIREGIKEGKERRQRQGKQGTEDPIKDRVGDLPPGFHRDDKGIYRLDRDGRRWYTPSHIEGGQVVFRGAKRTRR